jgi:putative ABC transport system permease protein
MLLKEEAFGVLRMPGHTEFAIGVVGVEAGTLELFDLKPLAGRFLSKEFGNIVLNETALHKAGFRLPEEAIGQRVDISGEPKTIVGVVKDFTLRTLERPIDQVSYEYIPQGLTLLDVKLRGQNVPETLAAIDRLWKQTGAEEPIRRYFLDEHIQSLYLSVLREAKVYGVLSAVAVMLGCLGLVGLSASAADRRTKEIGIRKALGANTQDVVRLMVWQLTRPVLWASGVAIPISAYAMSRWLEGFAFRIELTPWPFLGSAIAALAIAVLTVGVHCWAVASAKPVTALRYE